MGFGVLCLILLYGFIGSYAQPQCSLITPNVLRVDSEETIIVDGQGTAFDGDITIHEFPQKRFTLVTSKVSVNSNNKFFGAVKLTIPSKNLEKAPNRKQFVYVSVKSPTCNLEKIVLVSFHSGYIFIQTDKPIYTPGSKGLFEACEKGKKRSDWLLWATAPLFLHTGFDESPPVSLQEIFTTTPNLKPVTKPVVIEIMSPDNVIVNRVTALQGRNTGIISLLHKLDDIVSLGLWTISAKFEDTLIQSFTAQFEVKEYVLPNFEIKMTTSKGFFYINDEALRVDIWASYLYGKPVTGKALVLFGVKKDNEKKSLPDTLRRVQISDGEGFAVLKRQDLVKYFQQEKEMLEWRIYVSVTVITDSGSDMVESELNDIPIVTSPYKILYTKTPKYFKPGMPLDLKVFVTNPDGSPAHGVPVVAEPGDFRRRTQEDGTVQLTVNTRSDMDQLNIIVSTTDKKLPKDQQASATMVASAYRSIGGNYLHLSVAGGQLEPGESAAVHFIIQNNDPAVANQINQVNYVIMNKGRIMKVGTQERGRGQVLVTMSLPITEEFIPSFRILAYYTVTTGAGREIVADSIGIDVADTCTETLKITGERERDNAIQQPGGSMKLKLQADHMATVGLVAVDKGVYVTNDKLRLSQKKVWDSVEKYDIGCTPGSGADTPGVFYGAGLGLETSFNLTTPHRSEPLCHPDVKRRRRSSGDEDYSDYIDDVDIISRTFFQDSFLWRIETMNEKPDANGISTKSLRILLQDSITTWEVLAVSLSESKGICVSKPYNIEVRKDFFIDLKLPYSVGRNEQVEIRAILYNYGNNQLKMRVDWTYNEQICSLSTAKKKYRQEVTIKPGSSVAVPFIIVPLTLGNHEIEVKVKVAREFIGDGVKKMLKVVPEGRRLTQILKSVVLNPEGGVQEERITAVYPKNIVPYTEVTTIVTIQGSPRNETVEKPIDGGNLNHLIQAPRGSGEQIMMSMTATLIATHYLDVSSQWERVGLHRRKEAIQHIRNGVARQMTFWKSDGSHSNSLSLPSSSWLTAYVVKVFSLAINLIEVEGKLICDPVKWLILNKQNPSGKFREDAPVYKQDMVGGMTKDSAELDSRLTAFILIAMLASERTCADQVSSLPESIEKAVRFLNGQYEFLKKPYSIAITSFALAKAGAPRDIKILMSASTGNAHWDEPGSLPLSLEATSYALLTLLKMKEFEKVTPLVKWLTEQRYYGEVWGATQATMLQFEALAQYQIDIPSFKDLDLFVTYNLPGRPRNITHHLSEENALLGRSEETSQSGDITVTAKGKGRGILTVSSVYYALGIENEEKCNNFDLSVTIKEEPDAKRPDGAKSTVSMTICTRFLKNYYATMSVLDVSMMTGFAPDIDDLNRLKQSADRSISNFEINNGAFDKGTLILYIDRISHKEDTCLKFNLHQYFVIGLIQPGSVTVYDYYSPEIRCSKFYHVEEGSKLLGTICKGEVCRCAGGCSRQQQLDGVDALVRIRKACEADVDYVYKTTLTAIEKADNYDTYEMTIQTVLKEGTDIVAAHEKRNFISHAKCSKAVRLKIGQDYVIWGPRIDLWNTASGYSYLITKDTWVEMWPNDRECQKPENAEVCEHFFQFADDLEHYGCAS